MRKRTMTSGTVALAAALVAFGLADRGTAAGPAVQDTPACGATVRVPTGTGTVPVELCVPTLGYDDTSVTLVWKKPARYDDVVDYRVYQDGRALGLAGANASTHSAAKRYVDQFYADDTAKFHVKVTQHTFRVTGLRPATAYRFTVRAVRADGTESADSNVVVRTTAAAPGKVVDLGAGATLGEVDAPATTAANTAAVQRAIDTCAAGSTSAYGCIARVPAGKVLVTGALFLHSNMTLEIPAGATLKGSPNAADYPLAKGYQLYSFKTNSTDDRRPPSLLNLLSASHRNGAVDARTGYDDARGVFRNVRVVGAGTLDGNGWKRLADLTDEGGRALPQYAAGTAGTFAGFASGILARNQVDAAVAEYGITAADEAARKTDVRNLYGNRRSSLTTFRGVKDIYVGGLTLRNPSFHGVMFLESENIVFADTVSQTFDVNNADGVEFGSSRGALVFDNYFDTGDDNVNFAAGQGKPYENGRPAEHIWVFNNYMREGHGMIAIGSHTGALVQNVLAEDNVAYLTDNGLRLKSTPATGGGARRITFRDNAMRSVGAKGAVSTAGGRSFTDGGGGSTNGNAFILTLSYSAGSNEFPNASRAAQFRDIVVRNVTLDNVDATQGSAAIQVDGYDGKDATLGYPETFHTGVVFERVRIKDAKPANISRLKSSRFTDVTVTIGGAPAPASWWGLTGTLPQTRFTTVSPAPAAG